jgi:hypothetical protein
VVQRLGRSYRHTAQMSPRDVLTWRDVVVNDKELAGTE